MILSDFTNFFTLILNKLSLSPLFVLLICVQCALFTIYIFKRLLNV